MTPLTTLLASLNSVESSIKAMVSTPDLNLNSRVQVSRAVFGEGQTQSVSRDALEAVAGGGNVVAAKVLKWRSIKVSDYSRVGQPTMPTPPDASPRLHRAHPPAAQKPTPTPRRPPSPASKSRRPVDLPPSPSPPNPPPPPPPSPATPSSSSTPQPTSSAPTTPCPPSTAPPTACLPAPS